MNVRNCRKCGRVFNYIIGQTLLNPKCFEKLKEIKSNGTTIIIVSHSLSQIEQICDRTIWIEDGLIKEEGIPKFVHEKYLASMEDKRLEKIAKENLQQRGLNTPVTTSITAELKEVDLQPNWSSKAIRSGNRNIEFTNVELRNANGDESIIYTTGDRLIVHMEYKSKLVGTEGNFGVGINRDDGVYCYGTNTLIELDKMITTKSAGVVEMIIPQLTLLPAKYILDVAMHTMDEIPIDKIHHIIEFQVKAAKKDFGVARLEHEWSFNNIREEE